MPESPQNMANLLRLIAVIQGPSLWFNKNRAVMDEAGGRPPVTGPMGGGGGGGKVTQMPTSVDAAFKRAQAGHEAETARRIAARQAARGITPDQAAYDKALMEQMTANKMERERRFGEPPLGHPYSAARGSQSTAFRNMREELWGRMSPADKQAWLRDANWQSWPVEQQRIFMERFMPQGIGGP